MFALMLWNSWKTGTGSGLSVGGKEVAGGVAHPSGIQQLVNNDGLVAGQELQSS